MEQILISCKSQEKMEINTQTNQYSVRQISVFIYWVEYKNYLTSTRLIWPTLFSAQLGFLKTSQLLCVPAKAQLSGKQKLYKY